MLIGLGIDGRMVAETLKADWLLSPYSLQTIVCMFLTPLGLKFLKSLLNCFISDQCVESRLQVKMNSPDSARDFSIKQEEPEDHTHISTYLGKQYDNDNIDLLEVSRTFCVIPLALNVLLYLHAI